MRRLLTVSLLMTVLVLAGSAQATDYVVPMWDAASGTGTNGAEYAPGDGSTWYLAHNVFGALRVNDPTYTFLEQAGHYDDDDWYQHGQTYPPEWQSAWTGSCEYMADDTTGAKSLYAWGIWNQEPNPSIVFKAPADGYYAFDGQTQYNWWWETGPGTHTTDVPKPGALNQVRIYYRYLKAATTPTTSQAAYLVSSPADFGINQGANGNETSGAIDLGGYRALQGVGLKAGEYLEFTVRARGLLEDPADTRYDKVFGFAQQELDVDSGDPMKIVGRAPAEGEIPWAHNTTMTLGGARSSQIAVSVLEGASPWTTMAGLDPMVWNQGGARMERDTVGNDGYYDTRKRITANEDGNSYAISMEALSAGTYSMDGTVRMTVTGATLGRAYILKHDAAGLNPVTLASLSGGAVKDSSFDFDLGAIAALQDVALAVGETITLFTYAQSEAGAGDYVVLDLGYHTTDPPVLTPEPATLAVLVVGLLATLLRRRQA